MRIIAGKYRSRKLITLEGLATRPTLDQTKEAIFSSLGGYINDFVILDVFGGSGALSLESISRGAKEAYIIDSNPDAVKIIKKNAENLGVGQELHVYLGDYKKILERLNNKKFDIVFLDPPFRMKVIDELCQYLIENDMISDGGKGWWNMRIGLYPGTFDPITNGHLDIIKRGSTLFDKLYILVANNINKKTMFTVEERMNMIKEATKDIDNIEVVTSDLLTVEYAKSINAVAMVRGLRMVSDFEYELQMATLNRCIDHNVETIFIMSSHQYSFLSSSSVKEIARFDGDISSFVPKNVEIALKNKLK